MHCGFAYNLTTVAAVKRRQTSFDEVRYRRKAFLDLRTERRLLEDRRQRDVSHDRAPRHHRLLRTADDVRGDVERQLQRIRNVQEALPEAIHHQLDEEAEDEAERNEVAVGVAIVDDDIERAEINKRPCG